jgi:hypothetical protein
MGKKKLRRCSGRLMDQRIPAFVTRLLWDGRKRKMKPARKRQRQVGKTMRRQVMEGKGQKFERETVITFNEAESSASVWTASEIFYRRLKNLGYAPTRDDERSAVFEIPKAVVRVLKPRVKRELTERQREALKKGHSSSKPLDIIRANGHEIAGGYEGRGDLR